MSTKNELMTKWGEFLGNAELPEIATKTKQQIVAAILEQQEKDSLTDPVYRDDKIVESFGGFLNEAEVAGDHGYDATKIASGNASGAITNIGPAVIGMVRRAIPQLIAFDIAGVQPMNQSTGQIFAMRAVYGQDPLAAGAKEAFHPMFAPDVYHSSLAASGATAANPTGTAFAKLTTGVAIPAGAIVVHDYVETGRAYLQNATAAAITVTGADAAALDAAVLVEVKAGTLAEYSEAMATSIAEIQQGFNGSQDNPWSEMGFRIDKQVVEARSRQLKAQYSIELAQDLRAVHGMDADAELSAILATEIMLEINREIVDLINYTAQIGKSGFTQTPGTAAGTFNFQDPLDVRGARWAGESYKALLIQIDKEANEIARQTGRGAGNFIVASRNVVSALARIDSGITAAGQGLQKTLNVDTTKSVFAGILGGTYKVYIDQYARVDYFTVGYKGANEMDAGIYYAPYVALTPLRGSDPKNFQPVLGFKTRYGVGINPFANSRSQAPANRINSGMITRDMIGTNSYFRKVFVTGL
ncbi:major capsid protein [Pectobacterium phage POP12]|nr:major capsid protein [Pectobacterium phage POP12]